MFKFNIFDTAEGGVIYFPNSKFFVILKQDLCRRE